MKTENIHVNLAFWYSLPRPRRVGEVQLHLWLCMPVESVRGAGAPLTLNAVDTNDSSLRLIANSSASLESVLDWRVTSAGDNLPILVKDIRGSIDSEPRGVALTLSISCRFAFGIVHNSAMPRQWDWNRCNLTKVLEVWGPTHAWRRQGVASAPRGHRLGERQRRTAWWARHSKDTANGQLVQMCLY